MTKTQNLLDLAANYNKGLPRRVRRYLNERGIPDASIDFHLLGWNGWRITIPILNRDGNVAFFKQAKDPEDKEPNPKMLASPGSYVELYGWGQVLSKPSQIVICEGEFDRLVLEAQGFNAVTSTGGAGTFREEWVKEFEAIPEVFICFDRDSAGWNGALRVGQMIPHARIMELPEEAGQGGDVTDFFVRLEKSKEDFMGLFEQAKPTPPAPEPAFQAYRPKADGVESPSRERPERIKRSVPIADVVGQYVKLERVGDTLKGLCPFHEDHNPSLVLYPATNTFFCYGCRKHGDVITFIREVERLSFPEALDALDNFHSQHGEAK